MGSHDEWNVWNCVRLNPGITSNSPVENHFLDQVAAGVHRSWHAGCKMEDTKRNSPFHHKEII